LLLFPLTLHAQTPDQDVEKEPEKSRFSIGGYVESTNYYGINIERTRYGINGTYQNEDGEQFTISKFEGHAKIDARYDFLDNVYIKTITYLHAATAATPILRRYFGDQEIINLQELYLSVLLANIDIRAGNQVIRWGTAYTINPTSYFNPFDMVEIVLRDTDELYVGIPAISANVDLGDFALRLVYAPVHTPTRLPERGGPWSLRVLDAQLPGATIGLPIEMARINNAYFTYDRHTIDDYSVGAKLSATMHGFDVSVSVYHGYDRDIVLFPKLTQDPMNPLGKIELAPYYAKVTSLGVDFAVPIWEFTLYGEAAYTFDKPAVVNITNLAELMQPIRHTGFLYCVLGINWVYDQDFRIIAEYLQGAYIGNNDRLVDPFFSNLLSGTVEKKLFDGALILEFKGIFNTWKHDAMLMPRIGWKFRDNLLAEIGLTLFVGNSDTLFGSYDGRDIVNLKVRYLF
jgi:hypothetical protein